MPKLNRDGHITDPNSPNGAVFIENIRKNSEKLNITFENALDTQDSFDWIGLFKSNLAFSKGTDQNWSTKLAKFYFDQLNRRVDRPDKNFNSLTHDYDKLFVNEDDKFLFLDKLSSLIQNLVCKRGDKEKNPILDTENQHQLIQNYIKIAHKNLGSEGLGKEQSLDSSASSANDGREINKIINEARKKIKRLTNFSKGHYDLGNIDIDEELEEIKSFLKDNKDHLGAPPSPSSINRNPQSPSFLKSPLSPKSPSFLKSPLSPKSPSFLKSPLSPKSPTAFSPSRSLELSPLNSKKVVLENLLKELKKIYDKTKYSQNRAELFAEPETQRAQSNKALEFMRESSVVKHLSSRLGSLADPETPRAQSPEANKLFADPETLRAQSPSSSPSTGTLSLKKSLLSVEESSR